MNTNLPDGTSADNAGIAAFAAESREVASAEDRLTWLDLLLEKAMAISATVNPDALIDALDEMQSLSLQWQQQIAAREAVSA